MEDVTRIVMTPVLTGFISDSITEVSCSSAQFTEEKGQRFSNELKTFNHIYHILYSLPASKKQLAGHTQEQRAIPLTQHPGRNTSAL